MRILFAARLVVPERLSTRLAQRIRVDLALGSLVQGLLINLLLCFALLPAASAQLLLSPTRVVFEGNARSMQIDVVNTTSQAATYRLTLVNRRMNQLGEFLPADTPLPDERFVDAMVRFSPRQLTVEPGGSQVIRLSLRKPQGLAVGEYRSHLLIERVLDASLASSIETAVGNATTGGLDIRLTPLVGALIPVIVREGPTSVDMSISGLSYQASAANSPALLTISLDRSGNRSVYGDLVVTFMPEGGASAVQVARVNGLAVYVPNPARVVRVALQPPEGIDLRKGRLKALFQLRPEEGGRVLAEGSIDLR